MENMNSKGRQLLLPVHTWDLLSARLMPCLVIETRGTKHFLSSSRPFCEGDIIGSLLQKRKLRPSCLLPLACLVNSCSSCKAHLLD